MYCCVMVFVGLWRLQQVFVYLSLRWSFTVMTLVSCCRWTVAVVVVQPVETVGAKLGEQKVILWNDNWQSA